jgi:sugar phosphate isomerase/epimerase
MNRRTFLATTTAAALAPPLLTAQPPRKRMVGLQVWVYSSDKPGYDCTPVIPQLFDDARYAGYDGVELMEQTLRHADAVSRIGEQMSRTGVQVIGSSYAHSFWDKTKQTALLDDAAQVIERLGQLKGRILGITVGEAPGGRHKTPDEFDTQADALRQVMALCAKQDITPNLHNHTSEVVNGLYDLRNTLQRVPNALLGPDLDWLFQAKVDVPTFLKTYASKLTYLHLRDHLWTGQWSEALGEGIMDFGAIARQLRQLNYTGDMTVELAFPNEFKPTRPIRESLKLSRAVVREQFGV